MEERFLYHIWDAGHLQTDLKTVSGKTIKIHYPGQFNTNRGPDFVNTVLSIGSEELQGSVEIHLHTQDWQHHNHQEDLYYNPVILHVVYCHNGAGAHTVKENGELCEILELQHCLSDDIDKLITDLENAPVEPISTYCELLSAIDHDHLQAILGWHGRQRLNGKVRRFNAQLSMSDFDQIFYEGIMEAAGYDKNKLNFLSLAQHVSFSRQRDWQKDGMLKNELAAIMVVSSGLLEKSEHLLPDELSQHLKSMYEKQPWQGTKILIDWHLFRIRPVNHPLKRLLAISGFIYDHLERGLLNLFLDEIEHHKPSPRDRARLFAGLFKITDDFPGHAVKSLGSCVINNIYLNIYLPVMLLYASKIADEGMKSSLLASWNEQPALADNHILRFMVKHLNPAQIRDIKRKSLYQQGLMNIFHLYCHYHLCNQCKAHLC